jgi:hypothetical protein
MAGFGDRSVVARSYTCNFAVDQGREARDGPRFRISVDVGAIELPVQKSNARKF